MRRTGRLFDQIWTWHNLRDACGKALLGKRAQADARAFCAALDLNLSRMAEQLREGTTRVGVHHQFTIFDPKQRLITVPRFEERVLHHAIMNVCDRFFDRWLIADTFGCRRGKGRERAVRRAAQFAARWPYFLRMDVQKYFDSVPHEKLLSKLTRLFKDERLLELFGRIVRAYQVRAGCGLPIGSLCSQYLANFYLGHLDRFVKERLRIAGYVRYMDDLVFWADETAALRAARDAVTAFLNIELCLAPKPPYVNATRHGMDWLGCRVYAGHIELSRRSRIRFRRRLARLEQSFLNGACTESELQRRGQSLVAFARAAGVSSWQFRRATLRRMAVSGHGL